MLFHMLCENGAIPAAFMLGIGSLPERWPVIRNIVERVYAQLSVGGRHGHLAQLPVVPLPPHEEQMVTSGKRCPETRVKRRSQTPPLPDSPATKRRRRATQDEGVTHPGRRDECIADWRSHNGVSQAQLAINQTLQELDLSNVSTVSVDEPLASARSMYDIDTMLAALGNVVERKRRAYVSAGVWDRTLEEARKTLQGLLCRFRELVSEAMSNGSVKSPSEEVEEEFCSGSHSSSESDYQPEGREGCSSDTFCVGSSSDALFQLTGGYNGMFCAKCVEILEDADPDLVATPVHG